ncbi:hypothetical protein AGMMS50293_08680 [Spirochaetia bacterium]|nr:hypothetical protein AGMMS50293_08680 [Spirochaetia bacterium]
MKIISVFVSALTLLLASCVSSQASLEAQTRSSSRGGSQAAASQAHAGQIPVEIKHSVLFADGSLDEYTTFEYDPSYSSIMNQARYSASDTMLEQVEFAYQEDKGILTTKITRDVENRLKNRVVYQYNNQGQLWRETLTNKSGKAVSSYEYAYDSKGNRITRIMNSGLDLKMAETSYMYNDRGYVVTSETKDPAGRKISSTRNNYDGQGNLLSQQVLNAAGEVVSVVNAVWQNGLEIKNEQIGVDGAVQLRITNEYGPEGELLRKTIENFQGESTQITQYEYTFKPDSRK